MLNEIVGFIRGILSRKADESSEQVEAQNFVLRDAKGRGRAVLAMLDDGPGLTLLNKREEIRAVLGLDKAGAYLQLWGKDNKTNVMLRMEGNEPDLVFFDANNAPRAALTLFGSGPNLRLWDAAGRCRVEMEMDAEGGPSLTLYDENEQEQARLPCPNGGPPNEALQPTGPVVSASGSSQATPAGPAAEL